VRGQQHSRSVLPSISAPLLWFDQLLVRDLPYWREELGEAPFWGEVAELVRLGVIDQQTVANDLEISPDEVESLINSNSGLLARP
jgi:hypothetical protein